MMDKAGTYLFVLHFKDNHSDKYKDHKEKQALELNAAIYKGEIVEVGFYSDLDGDGNPYEDDEKLQWDGKDPANPKSGEFAILRQQPPGNILYILAHVRSPNPPPDGAKVKVRLKSSVTEPKGIKVTLQYSGNCPQREGQYHFRKPCGQEIIMVDKHQQSIDDKQIRIPMSPEKPEEIAEVCTYDHAVVDGSNYNDSEAIEKGLTGHQKRHKKRGRARDKGWEMNTPTLPTLLRFIKAGGVEKIKVYDPRNPSIEHELPVKNQADILYYSGHGHSVDGSLECFGDNKTRKKFTVRDVNPSVNWGEDLEYFIIAGCAVLRPDERNGFAWGNATLKKGILKGLCGYYGSAPRDDKGAVQIARDFTNFLKSTQPLPRQYSNDRVLDAWLEANREYESLGIVYNKDKYWKVETKPWILDKVIGPFDWR
jgi:hypothetical protein